MGYSYYLIGYKFNHDIFKSKKVKDSIINSSQKYDLICFCADERVTSQMIYELLDDDGIQMLSYCDDKLNKMNGIIACGKDISNLFDNELFLEMLVQLDDYYFYLKENDAVKFINYVINRNPNGVIRIFKMLNDEVQLSVISQCDLTPNYYQFLPYAKKSTLEYILDRIISLDDVSYESLLYIFGTVHVPKHLLDSKFVKKITTMYNVRQYRRLINELSRNNDISDIEDKRKKFYDDFLQNCSGIYGLIEHDITEGKDLHSSINEHLNCFGGVDSVIRGFYSLPSSSGSIVESLKRSLNYITTDIVVDYLFEDYAYNVFADIKELIVFDSKTHILSKLDDEFFLPYFKTKKADGEL